MLRHIGALGRQGAAEVGECGATDEHIAVGTGVRLDVE
jgi:hypothetical protein